MSIRYRTLLRVITVAPQRIWFVIPGWNPDVAVCLQNDNVPEQIVFSAYSGQTHFHAKVNLDAETAKDLLFTDWEVF